MIGNSNTATTGWPASGLTVNWNHSGTEGEADLYIGPGAGAQSGLQIFQLNSSGTIIPTSMPNNTILTLTSTGNLGVNGAITAPGGLTSGRGLVFTDTIGCITWPIGNINIYQDSSGYGPGDLVIHTGMGSTNNYTIFDANGMLHVPGRVICSPGINPSDAATMSQISASSPTADSNIPTAAPAWPFLYGYSSTDNGGIGCQPFTGSYGSSPYTNTATLGQMASNAYYKATTTFYWVPMLYNTWGQSAWISMEAFTDVDFAVIVNGEIVYFVDDPWTGSHSHNCFFVVQPGQAFTYGFDSLGNTAMVYSWSWGFMGK